MAEIVTETNCIRVDDALIPKNTVVVNLLPDGVRLTSVAGGWSHNIRSEDSTIDGVQVTDSAQLYSFFLENSFKDGGGSTGEGVQSITGNLVDNSDPNNPVVVNPTAEDITNATEIGINILKSLDAETIRGLLGLASLALKSQVFSGDIATGSINNAHINNVAGISLAKLGNLTTPAPINSPLTSGISLMTALNRLQGQIDAIIAG